ncbi:MAG: prepilin-type N-terminal cleavage/methylation domain-containing protein [Oligoflexia bacterium]|nr:prepilin-type N-terminal cleavage/methylation domain-containing protein [Oligoflexia bacterium]
MKKGFSLVELLVVVGLLGIVALGTASLLTHNMNAQRGISLKSEVQTTAGQVRLMMATSAGCKKVFSVGTPNAPDFSISALPTTTLPSAVEFDLGSITTDTLGATLSPGTAVVPGLALDTIKLIVKPPVQADEYLASLKLTFKRTGAGIGAPILTETIPLYFRVGPDPANPTTKKEILDCWEKPAMIEPKSVCTDLGGVWLEATQPGRQMPSPRCNMTQDIMLAANENPDYIPMDGTLASGSGATAYIDGYRVSQCYYQAQSSQVVSTFNCRTYTANQSGNRCAWNPTTHRWEVIYYGPSGPTSTVRRICHKGVQVSTLSEGSTLLEYYENLDSIAAFSLSAGASFAKKSDYLATVSRCNNHPTKDSWKDCANAKDSAGAKQGRPGHCIYVRNIKLYNANLSSLVNAYNVNNNNGSPSCGSTSTAPSGGGLTCINPNDYTGWIYVSSDFPRRAYTDGTGTARIREARGTPCFQVEVNISGEVTGPFPEATLNSPKDLTGTSYLDSTNANYKHPRAVVECVHEALSDPTEPASRPSSRATIFACEDDFTYSSIADLYVNSNWDDLEDQFPKGSCWHFTNARIKGYEQLGYTYTGWVYLKDRFKNTSAVSPAYSMTAASNDSILRRNGATPAPVPGVPCKLCASPASCSAPTTTAGVRVR